MILIKDILKLEAKGQEIVVEGWVKTKREAKNVVFLQVNDGSCFTSIQIAFDRGNETYEEILKKVTTGCSCKVVGSLQTSPAAGQAVEVQATSIEIYGMADSNDYPLQKKHHSFEFLRENAHLRARTNTFGAVARVRSRISYAIHTFFQENGFQYVNTPIITASDCEGAGEMFQVTTLNLEEIVKSSIKSGSSSNDFSKGRLMLRLFLESIPLHQHFEQKIQILQGIWQSFG